MPELQVHWSKAENEFVIDDNSTNSYNHTHANNVTPCISVNLKHLRNSGIMDK